MEREIVTSPQHRVLALDIRHRRLGGKGFGAYFTGSARRGRALIHIDCDALAWVTACNAELAFKRVFIETLGHEFMHALEDSFGILFDEDAVNASIEATREQSGKG